MYILPLRVRTYIFLARAITVYFLLNTLETLHLDWSKNSSKPTFFTPQGHIQKPAYIPLHSIYWLYCSLSNLLASCLRSLFILVHWLLTCRSVSNNVTGFLLQHIFFQLLIYLQEICMYVCIYAKVLPMFFLRTFKVNSYSSYIIMVLTSFVLRISCLRFIAMATYFFLPLDGALLQTK